MNRITKEEYYLEIARAVSKRSSCLRRKYGCVIINNDEIIATGYNGSARGETNCCDIGKCPRIGEPHNSGNYSNCSAVHAEQNAMLSASRKDMLGSTMYLAGFENVSVDAGNNVETLSEITDCIPCPICLRMIKNSGIDKLIGAKGLIWERS